MQLHGSLLPLEYPTSSLGHPRLYRAKRQIQANAQPTVCFAETLGDIMRGGSSLSNLKTIENPSSPGWLSWPFGSNNKQTNEAPNASELKSRARQARLQKIRNGLAVSRKTKPIQIPQSEEEEEEEKTSSSDDDDYKEEETAASSNSNTTTSTTTTTPSAPAVPWPNALSNAVPFVAPCVDAASNREGGITMPRATQVQAVLPWLFAAAGSVDIAGIEHLASNLELSRVQQLNLSSYCINYRSTLSDSVCWVGPADLPSPVAAAAATLHRMAHRRGGAGVDVSSHPGIVILNFLPHHKPLVAEVLSLYFHVYCGLDAKESLSAAASALQCDAPSASSLETKLEELAATALGYLQRVKLVWQYGGGSVEAAGDAVGGWNKQVPLAFSVQQRQWRVHLWGLPPGAYEFKYIVDGQWCVDMSWPTETDQWGNHNNVIIVPGCNPQDQVDVSMEAGDGMAAAVLPSMVLNTTESTQQQQQQLQQQQVVRQPVAMSVTPGERQSMARFGAAVLALYTKRATVKKEALC